MTHKEIIYTTDDIFSEFLGYGPPDNSMPDIKQMHFLSALILITAYFVILGQIMPTLSLLLIFDLYLVQVFTTILDAYKTSRICQSIRRSTKIYLLLYACSAIFTDVCIVYYMVAKQIAAAFIMYMSFFHYYMMEYKSIYKLLVLASMSLFTLYQIDECLKILIIFTSTLFTVALLKLTLRKRLPIKMKVKNGARYNFRRNKRLSAFIYLIFAASVILQELVRVWMRK